MPIAAKIFPSNKLDILEANPFLDVSLMKLSSSLRLLKMFLKNEEIKEDFDIYSSDYSSVGVGGKKGEMAIPRFKFQYDEKGNIIEKEWKIRNDMETLDLSIGATFWYSSKVVYKYKNFSKK